MKATLEEIREQIQQDLSCLLEGFGVADYLNCNGQSLEELVCQIVVDNFNRLQPQSVHKWSWYETLGEDWYNLNAQSREEIRQQFPDMCWENVKWASVLVEKE